MPLPTHNMVTRAKNGIFRPHPRYATPVVPAAQEQTQSEDDEEDEVLGLVTAEEPGSVDEALVEPVWKQAMNEEMECIIDNKTWALSMLPAGHRPIGLKWVFKLKKDPDGNVVKHKARLVVGMHNVRGWISMRYLQLSHAWKRCESSWHSPRTVAGMCTKWMSNPHF